MTERGIETAGRKLRIGIVCPYSFDVPGGVQFHVRDLAEALIARGHTVEVLAPADDDTPLPGYMTSTGKSIPVRYNGSVARLTFGPLTAARVRRWLATGHFDILHLHEPMIPSLSMLALWNAEGPIVATFHTSLVRSRALQLAYPLIRRSLEKIGARIAVSEDARRTLVEHLGGDAVVIPNGVYVERFAKADLEPRWQGTADAPTIAFLGRIDEPRKGLQVLLAAVPAILARYPGARFLVAGRGETGDEEVRDMLGPLAAQVELLGSVTDEEKARLLRSVDIYCAPHTGGESFGIVLVEAMSAGTTVVASDLGAFQRVLDDGAAGRLFRSGNPADLAAAVIAVLDDETLRLSIAKAGSDAARQYDWAGVTDRVVAVYEMVAAAAAEPVRVAEDPRSPYGADATSERDGS